MKSLVFGVYGNDLDDQDLSYNISMFSCNQKREITSYKLDSLHLYFYKGSTGIKIIENDNYFLSLSGDFGILPTSLEFNKKGEDIITSLVSNIKGVYTICLYDKYKKELFISNDQFGLYPLFYQIGKNNLFYFSNEYQALNKSLEIKLNHKSINTFFRYGFTLEGETFLSDIKKLKIHDYIFCKKSVTLLKKQIFHPLIYDSYQEWVEALHKALSIAVDEIFQKSASPMVTITGGLDSRLILAMTDEINRNKSEYITFFTTPLNENNDRDVIIAKKIAKQFSLKHSVSCFDEKTKELAPSYFDEIRNDSSILKITGLYGGELFASILYDNILPTDIKYRVKNNILNNVLHTALRTEFSTLGKRKFYLEKIASSFFSSIYGGTEGNWVHPWMNITRFFTPFMDTDVLKIWFSIPNEYLFNNRLYYDLFSFYPEYKLIPTNSFLQDIEKNGFQSFYEGIEPKQAKKSKTNISISELQTMEGFSYIPKKYRKINSLSNKINKQRVIDFCFWYKYYRCL